MPPLTLMIKPASGMCNMRCAYCFYTDICAHRETPNYGRMSIELLEKVVQRAFLYADHSITFVFQGGEPTLAGTAFFDALLTFEKRYNTRGLQINNSIQTNGLELSDEWLQLFRAGNFLVGISLDGIPETHNALRVDSRGKPTYADIIKNIDRIHAAEIDYNILCVVNHLVAERAEAVFHALEKHRYLQFIPCLDHLDGLTSSWTLQPGDYAHFLTTIYDLYEQRIRQGRYVSVRTFDNWLNMLRGFPPESCGMSGRCGNYFLIEADGSVYPCDFYVLDKWKLGYIQKTTLHTLGASTLAKEFVQESLAVPQECRSCQYYVLCRNGCKRERLINAPNAAQNRFCEDIKAFMNARYDRLCALACQLGHS